MKDIVCSVIVPMYNEEDVLDETVKRLLHVMQKSGVSFELLFINDGSRDRTAEQLNKYCDQYPEIKLIDFSRNFGHQTAITAGMDFAAGACMVIIDGDLQDPPEIIPDMINLWREGNDIVYGKRDTRKGDSFFKKMTAKVFYRLLRQLTDVDIPVDTGDFRLIDRCIADALKELPERNRYVRGLMSWVGYRQTAITFARAERFAGVTKYPLRKMLKLALDGIMSFSLKPLKLATWIGSFVSIGGFLFLLFVIIQKIISPETSDSGWASLMAVSLFFNGVVLLMLGIIGEYIGRIYDEAKGRPLYLIKKSRNLDGRINPRKRQP